MIIPEKKVIYIKIPKTGSTTVAREIWNHYGVQRLKPSDDVINLNFQDHEKIGAHGWHVRYNRVEEELGEEVGNYKIFTVIREPYDRMLSVFRWASQKNADHPLLQSFDGFIDAVERNDSSLPNQAFLHSRSQASWLQNKAGGIEDRMEIFPLDQLERCAIFFEEAFGFHPEFGHHNVSKKPPLVMSPTSRATIERLYKDDFELYHKFS